MRSPTARSWRMWSRALRSLAAFTSRSAMPCTATSSATKKKTMRLRRLRSRTSGALVPAALAGGGRAPHAQLGLERDLPVERRVLHRAEIRRAARGLLGQPHTRMPDAERIPPSRQTGEQGSSFAIAQCKKRRFGNVDVPDHPVMDVAADRYHARHVEQDRLRRRADVERQLEALGLRE